MPFACRRRTRASAWPLLCPPSHSRPPMWSANHHAAFSLSTCTSGRRAIKLRVRDVYTLSRDPLRPSVRGSVLPRSLSPSLSSLGMEDYSVLSRNKNTEPPSRTCEICGKQLATTSSLKRHKKQHDGERSVQRTTFLRASVIYCRNSLEFPFRPLLCPIPGCDYRAIQPFCIQRHLNSQ